MSKIEWTDKTINPVIGCNKISAGCNNCYAEKMAYRLSCMNNSSKSIQSYKNVVTGNKWNAQTYFNEDVLQKPKQWARPKHIFVGSMGDLFHKTVKYSQLERIMTMVKTFSHHTFIFLTKRPELMYKFLIYYYADKHNEILTNLWLGVSVEDQYAADKRIPVLLKCPGMLHFISAEPLLENIDIEKWLYKPEWNSISLDWVIVGKETGPKARKINKSWVQNLKRQCDKNKVSFFIKKI